MRPLVSILVAAALLPGCLTYEKFLEKERNKYCEELAKCNPDIPCNTPANVDTGYNLDDCDFDAGAARDCLNGTWTCGGAEGFEWPLGPQACDAVCKIEE